MQSGLRSRNERRCASAHLAPNLRALKIIELSRVSEKLKMFLVLIEGRCPLEAPQSFIRFNGVISSTMPGKHSLSSLSALIKSRPHAAPRAGTPPRQQARPPRLTPLHLPVINGCYTDLVLNNRPIRRLLGPELSTRLMLGASGAEQSRVTFLPERRPPDSCHTADTSLLISSRCKHSSHWVLEENA